MTLRVLLLLLPLHLKAAQSRSLSFLADLSAQWVAQVSRELEPSRIIETAKFHRADDCLHGPTLDAEADWIACSGLAIMKKEGSGVVIGLFVVAAEHSDDGHSQPVGEQRDEVAWIIN